MDADYPRYNADTSGFHHNQISDQRWTKYLGVFQAVFAQMSVDGHENNR